MNIIERFPFIVFKRESGVQEGCASFVCYNRGNRDGIGV